MLQGSFKHIIMGITFLPTSLPLECEPLKLVVILEKSRFTSPLGSLYSEYICRQCMV